MRTEGHRLDVDVNATDGRYHRQELISWWDQERLSQARILVVGAGALGNELLKNLALLGIGSVLVADMDLVENSNLSRCVLFRERDEGQLKADVAAAAMRELNPEVTVASVPGDVRVDVGLGLFAAADLVLGGLDNREARLHINQSCWKVGTPWIDGAIEGLMGTMRVFVPPASACYECTMTERDHELMSFRRSCALLTRDEMLAGKVPTTATSASVIAAMQVQEAVKLLHRDRIEPTFAGRGFAYNGLTHDSYVVTYPRRSECLSHDHYEPDDCRPIGADPTFGEILEMAHQELGAPVLELEREILLGFECPSCSMTEDVRTPLERLSAGAAQCPACQGDRRPVLSHSITGDDAELLSLRPSDLGLPRFDYVTARSGLTRRHFRLDGDLDPFDQLLGA